jgi:hypothetical protein
VPDLLAFPAIIGTVALVLAFIIAASGVRELRAKWRRRHRH